MFKKLAAITIALCCFNSAQAVVITFDTAIAGYTPNAPAQLAIADQFASLGLRIWDVENNSAASVGDCTGGVGSDPFHLYGKSSNIGGSGCGDTTPNIDFIFVDPLNMFLAGFTSDFSLEITDGHTTVLTAFDVNGNVLGTDTTTGSNGERIGVSGIGQIHRVNVFTASNATAFDDLQFSSVVAHGVAEPSALFLLGFGLMGLGIYRRRQTV